MSEPSIFEVVRRLDEMTRRLEEMQRHLEDRYVPRREYELRVGEVEKDAAAQAAFRRQIAAGALVGLLLILANIIISLGRIPGVSS